MASSVNIPLEQKKSWFLHDGPFEKAFFLSCEKAFARRYPLHLEHKHSTSTLQRCKNTFWFWDSLFYLVACGIGCGGPLKEKKKHVEFFLHPGGESLGDLWEVAPWTLRLQSSQPLRCTAKKTAGFTGQLDRAAGAAWRCLLPEVGNGYGLGGWPWGGWGCLF